MAVKRDIELTSNRGIVRKTTQYGYWSAEVSILCQVRGLAQVLLSFRVSYHIRVSLRNSVSDSIERGAFPLLSRVLNCKRGEIL